MQGWSKLHGVWKKLLVPAKHDSTVDELLQTGDKLEVQVPLLNNTVNRCKAL